MAQKIRILALAALASVMICPAQAADPSTPAQVTDDPASSESSIGESIGGFFKKIGEGVSKSVKDAVNRDPYAERTVIARGNVPGSGWAFCYKDDPTPDFYANIEARQRGIVGGKIVVTPFTCDNLIKSGVMKRVATGTVTGTNQASSKSADGEYVFEGCKISEPRRNGKNEYDCYTPSGVYLGYETIHPGRPPVFTPQEAERKGANGNRRSLQADPQVFENIARDANKEILRMDAEDRAKMAADESEHKRQSLQNQKEGMAKMDATLKKELERIHQMDKTMRAKGAASPQSQ